MTKRDVGSSLRDFLKAEGMFEDTQAQAIKEVVAWQLGRAMKERSLTKARMATLLKTSRSQLDRLLDAKRRDPFIAAAALVGRKVQIELV
jgi:hypothetical protein